jgi:hypothetical protein
LSPPAFCRSFGIPVLVSPVEELSAPCDGRLPRLARSDCTSMRMTGPLKRAQEAWLGACLGSSACRSSRCKEAQFASGIGCSVNKQSLLPSAATSSKHALSLGSGFAMGQWIYYTANLNA